MKDKLRYTIFAGVNGAGKTSMYRYMYLSENRDEKRINTDEMVEKIGSWKDNKLQIRCAREAVKLIKTYILEGTSFNQETTLSGKSIINNIKKAKNNNFYIVMNYIGVESPEVAKERVKIRVSKGGHGIPDEAIERRYYDSLENLIGLIELCDEINIYDNTYKLNEIMKFQHGKLIWSNEEMPKWSRKVLRIASKI
ncbi:ATPase [Clostridium senegalense]|uniref:zeta toxin family protein n=1 Tax=Clostridium senegalense TaxID=1465809 RepID=UPI001C0FF959|nr:zeta toxin family protein [Clostridium senegalense]MBU5227956.1 ATPase [Clostridium senegalense]